MPMMPKKKLTTLKPSIKTIDTRVGSSVAIERIRGGRLKTIRERILMRDEYTCRMCGHVSIDLIVDHIIPLHLGGQESDDNRQALCMPCHEIKNALEEKERGR